jgi:GNAT superfamily N-acetyltransferase
MGKMQLPEGYTGERVEARTASDELIAEINDLHNQLAAEARPELAGRPAAEAINDVRHMRSKLEDWTLVVRDAAGALVARAMGGVDRGGDNQHVFEVEIGVLPAHRRRRLGAWCLSEAASAAQAAGATLLLSWSESVIPAAEGFAKWAGFELALSERESDLVLADLDWEMVERWVSEGPERAPGYALEFLDGPYPEELYDDVIAWQNVMNDAPRGDLELNDDLGSREKIAEDEVRLAGSSKTRLEYIARHLDSGAAVGGTAVFYEPWTPTVLWQGATAVHPDHRGHALGKWLKAAMLLKVRELLPEVERVSTGNAYSNDPMLGINNKLGFKETRAYLNWQGKVAELLPRLDS